MRLLEATIEDTIIRKQLSVPRAIIEWGNFNYITEVNDFDIYKKDKSLYWFEREPKKKYSTTQLYLSMIVPSKYLMDIIGEEHNEI